MLAIKPTLAKTAHPIAVLRREKIAVLRREKGRSRNHAESVARVSFFLQKDCYFIYFYIIWFLQKRLLFHLFLYHLVAYNLTIHIFQFYRAQDTHDRLTCVHKLVKHVYKR